MEAKHTAGPWKVQRTITGESEAVEMTGHNSDGDTKFAVFVEAPAYVLAGVSGTGKAECLANARLIAAAPEMLEALEAILPLLDSDCASVQDWQEEAKLVRAAIIKAKAKGQP